MESPTEDTKIAVFDPGDLYTLVRCFFVAQSDGTLWSQADYQAADRLNKALRVIGWGYEQNAENVVGGTMLNYPPETLDADDDDGTMPANVAALEEAVIGHRIVSVKKEKVEGWYGEDIATIITLDNGRRVALTDTYDCCAFTELESFLLHPESVDHMILGVGTTDGYTTWHIFADFGDVMKLKVGWSCGNPFYYSFGFDITVEDAPS